MSKVKIVVLFGHILLWIAPVVLIELVSYPIQLGVFNSAEYSFFYPFYYGVLLNMGFFYFGVYWLLPKLITNYGILLTIVGGLLLYLVVSCLESVMDYNVLIYRKDTRFGFTEAFISNLLINFVFFLFVLGYFFIGRLVDAERKKFEIREEKLKLELSMLRSQLNPHFLFNTLNNLFATARKNKDLQVADGIAMLSRLMRYVVYDGEGSTIELKKEVDYLNNYITLQKMRFQEDDDISVNFEVNGEVADQRIIPMLLIQFVENAFKHGISLNNASYINMNLQVVKDNIIFSVRNSLNPFQVQKDSSGVGLQNAKRRLAMLYPDRHQLATEKSADEYYVRLDLEL